MRRSHPSYGHRFEVAPDEAGTGLVLTAGDPDQGLSLVMHLEADEALRLSRQLAEQAAELSASSSQTVLPDMPTPATISPTRRLRIVEPEQASQPEPEPVFSISTGDEIGAARPDPSRLQILPAADQYRRQLGLSLDDICDVIADPEDSWVDITGTKCVLVRGHVAVVTGLNNDDVLSVMPRLRAEGSRPTEPQTRIARHSGGSGTRYATTLAELLAQLRDAGATIRSTGSGHYGIRLGTRTATIPSTPSKNPRALRNAVKMLERELKIDLRRQH